MVLPGSGTLQQENMCPNKSSLCRCGLAGRRSATDPVCSPEDFQTPPDALGRQAESVCPTHTESLHGQETQDTHFCPLFQTFMYSWHHVPL